MNEQKIQNKRFPYPYIMGESLAMPFPLHIIAKSDIALKSVGGLDPNPMLITGVVSNGPCSRDGHFFTTFYVALLQEYFDDSKLQINDNPLPPYPEKIISGGYKSELTSQTPEKTIRTFIHQVTGSDYTRHLFFGYVRDMKLLKENGMCHPREIGGRPYAFPIIIHSRPIPEGTYTRGLRFSEGNFNPLETKVQFKDYEAYTEKIRAFKK